MLSEEVIWIYVAIDFNSMATLTANLRVPEPLRVTGSKVADEWRRLKEQFENYELASDLIDASQQKRAAVFLTCIGNEA